MKIMGWVAVAFIAFSAVGCVTKSTVTEGDREVIDQTGKAIDKADSCISEGKVEESRAILAVARENVSHQQKVHGTPEKPVDFSMEASKAARDKSTQEHASGSWILPTLTVLGAICGIAASAAGMPFLAPIFPALAGKLGKWATTGSQIITAVRAKAEEQGGSIHVADILSIAKEKNVSAGVQKLVTKYADKHEEAMGHDFGMNLDSTTIELTEATPTT